jgi:hypothetical protein
MLALIKCYIKIYEIIVIDKIEFSLDMFTIRDTCNRCDIDINESWKLIKEALIEELCL